MQEKHADFQWTVPRVKAAQMVADDRLIDERIAEDVGVSPDTLWRWKRHPAFKARVAEIVSAYEAAVLKHGIARRERRVAALDDRWDRMAAIIAARAEEYADQAQGGEQGLLVKQVKQIGAGESATLIEEFVVDTGLLNELRQHEKQAAQELGQWTERREVTGKDGGAIEVKRTSDLSTLTDTELDALDALVGKLADTRGDRD